MCINGRKHKSKVTIRGRVIMVKLYNLLCKMGYVTSDSKMGILNYLCKFHFFVDSPRNILGRNVEIYGTNKDVTIPLFNFHIAAIIGIGAHP